MNKKLSFASKIITAVSLAFIFTFSIVYFVILDNYKKSILLEEESKIELLLNTISPIVAINIDFELYDNIQEIFQTIVTNNKEIVNIKLLNTTNNKLIKEGIKDIANNCKIEKRKHLYDTTNKKIGTIIISYSNENYLKTIAKFNNILLYILLFIILFMFIFSKYLSYLFKPFEQIASELEKYNPKDNRILNLKYNKKTDEIAIINNVIVSILDRIETHTSTLEERVKVEVKNNTQKELQLLEQSKMASMGEMIGNIAHQWRQPLSVISTIASGIHMRYEFGVFDEKEIPKDMNTIVENTKYLSNTIDTFRDFIKEEKELKSVIIQERIDISLNIIIATLDNNHIKIKKNIDYNSPITLNLVVGELSQVIINILNNAKDILIENDIKDKWIDISLTQNDTTVIITIEDNAGGIPSEVMPKIFDPYFTTKHQSQGTGLGLHMSYKIITESLNGKLYVKNTSNGAKFFIELPKN